MPHIAYMVAAGGGAPIPITYYEAEDQTPGGAVTAGPSGERGLFMARLTVTGVEDWEGYAQFDPIDTVAVTINGTAGTFSAPTYGQVLGAGGAGVGRFNTTSGGVNWLDVGADDPICTITFAAPIAAFGFYATDMGDFTGRVSVVLNKTGGGTVLHDIAHTVNGSNGSLLFFGFVDEVETYDSIEIRTTNTAEGFGIDDLIWATAAQLS